MRGSLIIAAVAALVLAGCGATKPVTQTSTVVQTQTQTQTQTTTDTHTVTVTKHAPAAPARAVTVTATRTTAAPAQPPPASSSFSGTGIKSVGTVNIPTDSTLSWTCSGDCSTFSVSNNPTDQNSISLFGAGSHSGTTAVTAGMYHQVQIITGGSWTFRIG